MPVALHAYLSLLQRPVIGHARITMTDRELKPDLRAPGNNVVNLLLVLVVEHHINIPWHLMYAKFLQFLGVVTQTHGRMHTTCTNICMYTISDILAFDAENPVSVQTSTSSATHQCLMQSHRLKPTSHKTPNQAPAPRIQATPSPTTPGSDVATHGDS